MPLVKGPLSLRWGDNTLSDIEEIETDFEVNTADFTTVQGQTYESELSQKASVTLTFLGTDIASLAAVFPQYFVANGQTLSTGETVNHADGAIDFALASCDATLVYNNLDITGCGQPGDVTRLVNARTRLSNITFADSIRRVEVSFVSEPAAGEANIQLYKEGTISVVS